jgi:IS30 family transposase
MTMRADSCSARLIAKRLGRSPSSICRELKRTDGGLVYDAVAAHQRSEALRVVPRRAVKLQSDGVLFQVVVHHLKMRWRQDLLGYKQFSRTNKAYL